MSTLEQLVGQLRFIDRCSPDHQAAVTKDLRVILPDNDRRHHTVSILCIDDTSDHLGIGIDSRCVLTTLSYEESMPRSVTGGPRSKLQALCLQIETYA